MISVTTPFINEIKKDSYIYREYITIGNDTKKILVKAKIFDDCYFEGNFIGTFIMKRIEIETESDVDYKKKEITFYKGVKVGTNWEDLKIGTFIITDISLSDTKELIKITGYDYALKFAQPYITTLSYSSGTITLQMVLDEITTTLGLSKVALDINGNFIVDSNQFEGQQYGNVIQAIALSTGNFAKIDQNNNLKFIFKTPTDIIINDYVELEDKRDTRPITIVTLGMSQVEGENVTLRWEQGITLYGENYLIINDNPFTNTQEKRQQQIQAIFDKIKGFSYSSFSTKSAFIPQGQCGDLIKFKNKAGTLIESIILRYSSDYDDVLLEAPSIIKASVNYQNEPSLELQIKNTQIIVDKQAQTISMQIKNINDLKDDLNNNYSTKNETTNLITQTIKYTENVITETGGSNILINPKFYQNAEGWEKSENCIFEVITDNTEVEQNTNCKTEMILKSGRLSQRYTQIIGEKYTIAFKYKKPAENINKCSVKLFRNDIDYLEILNSNLQKVNREDISIGYIASVNNPKIIIEADNTEFKINDLIIQPGISTQFSNNTNELRGTSYKITKENYTHYNLATKEKGEYDSNDVKYYNQEGNIVAEYGLSESIVNKGTFNTELNLGNLKCLVISNDDIIIY